MTTGSTIARFTITLSKSVAEPVQVAWNTKDGTAKAGIDYAAASGTAVFSPGETNKDVDVLVYGRAVGTEDRNFFLEMTPPPNAILGESIGECIIYLDTAGNTAVIQVIVPTGPQGDKGDSAYQSWLNLGNTGTERDFIDSLRPPVEEIAAEVAPILDISSSPLTAEGTETLSKPDTMTGKRLARRVAYVGAAKVATVVLADGDNLITHAALSGDAVDLNSISLYPRILRGTVVISPEWSVEPGDKLLIKSAVAGDVLHVCQYDVISDQAAKNVLAPIGSQAFEALRRSYAKVGYNVVGTFQAGFTIVNANDVGIDEVTGKGFTGPAGFVAAGTDPASGGFVDRSNSITITVNSVSDLKNVSVLAGAALPSVRTLGHTMSGLGGGVYEYEYPTSKTDNGGSWIQSNALPGVWVLKSYCYAETFGVVPGSSDQSIRLQAYIDFCLANSVFSMAFEKPNAYTILNSVSFTQDPNTANVQKPSLRRAFYFNGAVVYLGADNLNGFVVSRDFITLVDPNIKTDKAGCTAVYNGLPVDDLSTAKRRSSQFMKLVRPCFEGVDIGVHFKPAATVSGQAWGAYYHFITDYALRDVNIGFLFDQCPTNDNATTRTGFSGGSHVGGSCTFLCLNAETITATGWSSEFLKRADSRLPNSEAVGVYMPPRNGSNTMDNGYSVFKGAVEASTNSHNIDGVYNDVEIVSIGITNPIDSGQVVGVDLIDTKHKTGSLAAATRATNPAKAPKLYLRRYIDATPNGGSTFSVGENTSGGFDIYAAGTTDNDISFSTGPVRVKNIGANIVTPNQIVLSPYKTVTSANLLVEFYNGRPILRASDSGAAHFSGFVWSPYNDNTTDVGSASNRVKQFHAVSGAINTSDSREKTEPSIISDALLDAADDVQIILFKWLSAVREKGEDGARWHFGAIAQQVRDALAKHGVNGIEYGLLCYDKWDDSWDDVYEDVLDEYGNVVDVVKTGERKLVMPAGDRWGLRPDECHWWLLAAAQRRLERVEKRLVEIEEKLVQLGT